MDAPEDRAELWRWYNDKQTSRTAARDLLMTVCELAGAGDGRSAVDLGCGAGVESAELAKRGWRVTAVDSAGGTEERVQSTVRRRAPETAFAVQIRTDDFVTAAESLIGVDLLYSGYALPYAHPRDFGRIWTGIRDGLAPGGWLAVDLFGDRDSYIGTDDWNFHTEEEARSLFDGLEVVRFDVQDEDGMAAGGPKHWHVFHVIARAGRG